jgi:hypothetical protein
MKGRVIAAVLTVAVGIGCSAHAQSFLTSAELERTLIGKTLGSTTKRGLAYTITFSNANTGIYTMNGDKSELSLNFNGDTIAFRA